MAIKQSAKNKNTDIELFIINKVKEFREKAGMSQRQLCMELRLSWTYVFRVESSNYGTKYNFNQLNELAKIFGCRVGDFMPNPFLETDCVEQYMQIHPEVQKRYERMIQKTEEKSREKVAIRKTKKE